MFKKDWTLFKRKTKKHGVVYYVNFVDPKTNKIIRRSTGQILKRDAKVIAEQIYTSFTGKSSSFNGYSQVLSKKMPVNTSQKSDLISFEQYASNFWDWDNSPYVLARRSRGTTSHPGIRIQTVRQYEIITKKILIPFFGKFKLYEIKSSDVDAFTLVQRNLNKKTETIKSYRSVLSILLDNAVNNSLIEKNPVQKTLSLIEPEFKRELLTSTEIELLKQTEIWKKQIYRLAFLISIETGMRLGEILSLQNKDIFPNKIEVSKNITLAKELGPTKNAKTRIVPISFSLYEIIQPFKTENPEDFIFSRNGIIFTHTTVEKNFYYALNGIGISKDERLRRHLTFHSLRSSFVTNALNKGIPKDKIAAVTGHLTLSMVDHYTNYSEEDILNAFK